MIAEILYIIALSLVPFIELRGSIPLGLALGLPWPTVFSVTVLTNTLSGPVAYLFLYYFMDLLKHIPFFDHILSKLSFKNNNVIAPKVEKHGSWILAVFIGIPWPGTGAYSGAFFALILKLGLKRFFVINLLGNLIAGTIVMLASMGVLGVISSLF